jgi:hypothetical protein
MDRRKIIGLSIFAVGTVVCVFWAYTWIAPLFAFAEGSGGIGAVSAARRNWRPSSAGRTC